jgi:hypothetical protein
MKSAESVRFEAFGGFGMHIAASLLADGEITPK